MMSGGRAAEILYGRNAVLEALGGRRALHRLLVAEGAERQPRVAEIIRLAEGRGLDVQRPRPRELDRLLGAVNHQGVALEASGFRYSSLDDILASGPPRPLLMLDHIQDPQNLGALMRAAEASAVAGLVIPDRRAAAITPAVVNASAGAVEHLRVARVKNLARAVEQAKEAGYWVIALEAVEGAPSLFDADLPTPAALVVGSEGKGIAPTTLRSADVVVRLPMLGRVASLNAAVAGSIALFELVRRSGAAAGEQARASS